MLLNNEFAALIYVLRGRASTEAVANDLRVSRFAADRALRKLHEDGYLAVAMGGNRRYWTTTDKAREVLTAFRNQLSKALGD